MMLPLLAAVAMAVPADPGVTAYLKLESIAVAQVAEVPRALESSQWKSVASRSFPAFPQNTLRLPDRKANGFLGRGPTQVQVQALHDGVSIAIRLTWHDDTKSFGGDTAAFGDAAAIEFPENFGRGTRLPYIGMGDAEQSAIVYLMRAFELGSYGREYIGAGFGSLTRTKAGALRGDLQYDVKRQTWRALFIRPLVSDGHSLKKAEVPIAFAVWEGSKNERGGNKALTSWKILRLAGLPSDGAFLKELAFGYGPGELGNAAAGRAMVESMCIACHHVGDKKLVPAEVAPNLIGIGNITTYSYLRDSIRTPSLVLVPNPNLNRHYQANGTKDRHGALPNDPAFAWSVDAGDGKVASKMPPFPLPPEVIANMLAFLKPLPSAEPTTESK